MPKEKLRMHFIVYDTGEPWKRGAALVKDYRQAFKQMSETPLGRTDQVLLDHLPSDSYESIVGPWNGKGVTPDWLWKDCKAIKVLFVSHESVML